MFTTPFATPSRQQLLANARFIIFNADTNMTLCDGKKPLSLMLQAPLRIKIDYIGICTVSVDGDLAIGFDRDGSLPDKSLEINMAIPEDTYLRVTGTQGTLTVSDPR